MKKILSGTVLALLLASGVQAQTIYDAMKIQTNDLSGTARFVGMGGAMGALGGDISTIATNPAGIGLYRSSDASITFGYSNLNTKSTFDGFSVKNDKNRFDVSNVGFVVSTKMGDYTPLRFINVGFNYKRSKSLSKVMGMSGELGFINFSDGSSMALTQTNQMAAQANAMNDYVNNNDISQLAQDRTVNLFDDNYVGWLAALGWKSSLIYQDASNGYYYPFDVNSIGGTFYSKESGGVDQFDLNLSFNVNDRAYFGITFGFYDVNYKKYSSYTEDYGDGSWYTLQSWNKTEGDGFDFKLGAIVRPFEYSPFRIGLAIHTPTIWNLRMKTSARVDGDFYFTDNNQTQLQPIDGVDSYDYLSGRDMAIDYYLQTPWKMNWSLGYTIGTQLAFGLEYEFADYSHTKFRYDYDSGNTMQWETSTAKDMLKAVNTLRLGVEYRFVPEFAWRAGYNISSAAFKKSAWKDLIYNSVVTDTDFANTKAVSNYTVGFGYRGPHFYADLAYKYNTYKEDFYAFDSTLSDIEDLWKTKVKNENHQLLLTLGYRF